MRKRISYDIKLSRKVRGIWLFCTDARNYALEACDERGSSKNPGAIPKRGF
jgi:hypothetical protein